MEGRKDLDLLLGMEIYARLADTRFDSTLMGRVLPGLIKNRVEFGFKKKHPKRVRARSRFW